jgi:hypothetical protein
MTDHPDTHEAYRAAKQITRGGNQAADDQAIKAYHRALDEGRSRGEAEIIFSETYKKCLHGISNGWANV